MADEVAGDAVHFADEDANDIRLLGDFHAASFSTASE